MHTQIYFFKFWILIQSCRIQISALLTLVFTLWSVYCCVISISHALICELSKNTTHFYCFLCVHFFFLFCLFFTFFHKYLLYQTIIVLRICLYPIFLIFSCFLFIYHQIVQQKKETKKEKTYKKHKKNSTVKTLFLGGTLE